MDSKNKIKLFFTLEVLVWLCIVVFCIVSIKFFYAKKQANLRTYRIFMQDVDGLIEGSSVRLMGVPIGYVKTISIVQNHVYVKFVITNNEITLPQGVIATAEFNGMAGSKSLELYPPDAISKASGNLIEIKKTNRLGAALGLFDDMFAKFDSIMVRCNHFSQELNEIFPKSETSSDISITKAENSLKLVDSLVNAMKIKKSNFDTNLKPIKSISKKNKNNKELKDNE